MKYLKPFNESKNTKEFYIQEILSKGGWEKIEPTDNDSWLTQLEYKLTDSIKIVILDLSNGSRDLPYYLVADNHFYYISSYNNNYTQLFSEYNSSYRDMSHYDRMIKICKYLLDFYKREPDESLKQDIRNCFIEIEDDWGIEVEMRWGYCDAKHSEFGFFPAFSFSDKLCLSLAYNHYGKIKYNNILELIEDGVDRVENMFYIHKSHIKTFNDDDWRIIIRIEF